MKHEFIARASQMGALMTNPRTKGETLSETTKTAIQEAVLFNKYGIEKHITSKEMEKGTLNEEIGIEMASKLYGWFGIENQTKQRIFNDYVSGECDILTDEVLADIKCPFKGVNFPFFETEVPNKAYFYQLQAYMWLTDRTESELIYCLTNTPDHIIDDEIRKEIWFCSMQPKYFTMSEAELEAICDERIRKQHIFDHIPLEKRVKKFIIQRDEETIEAMRQRIILCREYYDSIYEQA
jgi:hypothetical protein